jgi:alkaline phosphatase D
MSRPAGDYYAIAQAQVSAAAGAAVDYRVTRDGATVAQGSFRAARAPRTAPFTIAVAACADLAAGRDQPAWAALAARQPQLLLLVGDNAYPNTSMRSMVWAEYLQQRGVDSYAAALRHVPVLATWDDHDFGPNNSGGEDVDREFRDESARAFRELHPGLPYAAGDGIYYRVGWQDVDVFMLDVRYFRHRYRARTGFPSTRHMLGSQQWQWLERELAASQAAFKLVVSGTTLDSGATETWADDYTTEWMRLRALALATPGMVVVSGDIHRCEIHQHRLGPTRLLWEIVSSGIGTGSPEHGFATITVDATVPDPTLTAQLFRKNGDERVDERVVIRRSRIS